MRTAMRAVSEAIVAVARNVVPQTRFAALEPLTRSHVVQKPPLLLADLLGHGIVHITQVEGLRLLHGHRLPAGEIIRDSLADGRGIQRRIHFQQVGTHVETDDISHRIGIGVQFHPAAAFGTTAPQRQHQDRKDRKSFHIVGRFNSLPQASWHGSAAPRAGPRRAIPTGWRSCPD